MLKLIKTVGRLEDCGPVVEVYDENGKLTGWRVSNKNETTEETIEE